MKFLNPVLPLVAGTLSLFTIGVQARSQAPNAIRHVSTLDQPTIKTPSKTNRIDHLSNFDITFSIGDREQRIKLELKPNHDVLAEDAFVQYLGADGRVHAEEPISRHQHKVFKGRTLVGRGKGQGMWDPVGWARIYVTRDGPNPLFEGVFNIHGDSHHVELQSTYLQKKRPQDIDIAKQEEDYMVFYRDSDLLKSAKYSSHTDLKRDLSSNHSILDSSCQADQLGFNSNPDHPVLQTFSREETSGWASLPINSLFGLGVSKRSDDIGGISGNAGIVNLQDTIGDTSGCPSMKQVALIGVATDCALWEKFNGTEAVQRSVINIVNSASNVFENSFNISLGLRNITVTDRDCTNSASTTAPWNIPCTQGDLTQRLDLFSEWRGQQSDENAYWTLMTDCSTGAEVGLAWLGQLCNTQTSSNQGRSVSGTNVVVSTGGAGWQIFAHESGHTFGAIHDCTADTCKQNLQATSKCCPYSSSTCDAGGDYIMNPSTGSDITQFSQCSIGNVCAALGRNSVKSTCLSANRDIETFTGAQCGNGIVESGEDCDCGGEESCGDNSCCNASTCKFTEGSECDDANDSCCNSCQIAAAGTVCRPSTGECDPQETCSGTSSICPSDTFEKDGDSCGSSGSGLACASGQCTSRDAQCKSMMGSLQLSTDTRACNTGISNPCQLACQDLTESNMWNVTCYTNDQNFLDGTPCGDNGRCRNGSCEGEESWLEAHKNIIIPVAAGVGGLIVLAILISIFRRCRRSRYTMKPVPPVAYGQYNSQMPPPPPQQIPIRRLSRAFRPGQGPPPPMQTAYPGPYQAPYPGPQQGLYDGPPPPHGPNQYPTYPMERRYDDDGPPPGYMQTMRYA
ncbi:Metallo-peptidase family M12-domain-containing protein [Aspergillus granulosus]|uniref:Metallo-peptidase family M12-domain-containing protein n=1 Tax=Aspergillus granulosus TaxID=176169 RepID=A0ABR4HVG4_9EURO